MSCSSCGKHKNVITKVADKLGNMAVAYTNKITGHITPEAKQRIATCKICIRKTTILGIDVCKECGCPIDIKPLAPKEFCKLNKWD